MTFQLLTALQLLWTGESLQSMDICLGFASAQDHLNGLVPNLLDTPYRLYVE
jgi:hypothetical protein